MGADLIQREGRANDWEHDERYRQLVELAPDGILIHDDGRVVLANASAARLAGATDAGQLIGLPIDRILDPPYLKSIQSQIVDGVSSNEPAPPVRDTFHRLDGVDLEVEVRTVAFMDRGRPAAHLVIRDISDRLASERAAREMDKRLQQAQRMETVGALAGGVAHEVNNMMAVILGFSDFVLRNPGLPTECSADVLEIIKAADRASAFTRQLLAFSRRAVHIPEAVGLAAAVHAVEPAIRRLLGESRPLTVLAALPTTVWVDPGQLEQVIINLALNARDAMPESGSLTITTGEALLPSGIVPAGEAVPAERYATVEVRDTGHGMSADIRARLFEPFFTTKPVGQGTGLGMAAAHGILTQHHGYIGVDSAPGQGTTFTIYLPIHFGADGVSPRNGRRDATAESRFAGSTVMVVEDEAALRSIVSRSLEQEGFAVLGAANGEQALELIDRHGPPSLLLTDLTMPGMGGAELARSLKLRWPALPVLFMSGYSASELHRQGAIEREGDLIQKPFSPKELVARVTETLMDTTPV